LRSAQAAVKAGATLVFSGKSMPLLEAFASWTGGKPVAQTSPRPDIVFEDFEHGYNAWKIEGEAFGREPAKGTLPSQQHVSGFLGHGLVNSYLQGDDTTGRLISKPFRIERHFIRFLVGGGHHEQTQIRLLIENKIVRATSGKDNERLEPAVWDVAALEGQTAHLEIVDDQKGGWGHINVDQIEFSDLPGNRELMEVLEDLLPARFSGIRTESAQPGKPGVQFEGLMLKPGATQSAAAGLGDASTLYQWTVGKGKVIIVAGPVLEPAKAAATSPRQRAYAFLCGLLNAKYEPCERQHPKAPGFGSLALASLDRRAKTLLAFENWDEAWQFITTDLKPSNPPHAPRPTPPGRTIYGAVAATVEIPDGQTTEVPFLLAWHYPNKFSAGKEKPAWMGCHYATQWPDARAVILEASASFEPLRTRTELFRKTIYDSTLPYWLLDCLTANAAIIRHIGVVFRIANGDVYGWEGSNGCCDPTCTHVWGYEQTLSRLFPDLERDMRRIDFKHQQRPDGGVNNRTEVPSPPRPTGEQPFADGHASCILKAYREALNSPDERFFTEYWPHIKRAVEYLIGRDAKGTGGQPAGILQDDQWNTYDEALHGVTTFIGGYYLAALRAGEEWARRSGDADSAARYRAVFERGQKKLIELCWNGEYFEQHLPGYQERQGEVGPGCMSDQLIGQWWAHQLGLGYLLPQEKVIAALRAVYKYNFKTDLSGWKHAPRAFAGTKDKGLIICTWPKGGRPAGVMLYSDEVWTGIEYQAAAHMIYEGLVDEGLAIVKAARERYDGVPRAPIPRNPWNEIECGGHYARAMSSWSLLLALSGWECDGPRNVVRFAPRCTLEKFKSFFAAPECWGSLRQSREAGAQRNEFAVVEGTLKVKELVLVPPGAPSKVNVDIGGRSVESAFVFSDGAVRVSFAQPATLKSGQTLSVRISPAV
jgi:familyl 116 glycosyl hydrolase-like protein/glycosyl hydrolase family 116 (putative beta-glucocerebrosidase)